MAGMQPYYLGFLYPLVFLCIVILISRQKIKANKKRTQFVLSQMEGDIIDTIEGVKAEVFASGRKGSKDFYFRKCDIYVLEDAVFLATYSLLGQGKPLFLSANQDKYAHFKAGGIFPDIKKINPDSFSHSVYIEYGESSFSSVGVDIHLYGLTNAQREYFRF